MLRLLLLVSLAHVTLADDIESMNVPTYLMNYILDCKRQSIDSGYGVPVYQTNIKQSGTSQHVSLLDVDELEESLKKSVHNDAVVKHVINQVNDAVKTASDNPKARSDCTVENHIQIEVPPQEMDEFNDRVQMLIQQNSFLLLEQINTLFTFKLRSLKSDMDKVIRRRYKALEDKLDLVLGALGVALPEEESPSTDDDENDDDNNASTEIPAVITDSVFPSMVTQPAPSPEPEPVATPSPFGQPETTVQPAPEPAAEPAPEPAAEPAPEPISEPGPTPGLNSDEDDDDDDLDFTERPDDADATTEDPTSTEESSNETPDASGNSTEFTRTSQQQQAPVNPIVTHSGFGFMPSLASRPFVRRKVQRPSTFWRDRLQERRTRTGHPTYNKR